MNEKTVMDVIKENYSKIYTAERKVASYVLAHPTEVIDINVAQLAQKSDVSDATVIRMCHHLGYKGYYQFRLSLARDAGRNTTADEVVQIQQNSIQLIFNNYAQKIVEIGESIDENALHNTIELIKKAGEVYIIGVGNTMPLVLYMGFRLGRLGIRCVYDVGPEYFLNHINLATKQDIVIAISHSGSSNQVIQGIELAKNKGIKVIAITASEQSPVYQMSDYSLLSAGCAESFNCYKSYAHLREMAVIDALLEMLTNWETIQQRGADIPEMILAEYKY
jgi:RpiR family transcriptional regulator, carbohydrate utilization regulator